MMFRRALTASKVRIADSYSDAVLSCLTNRDPEYFP